MLVRYRYVLSMLVCAMSIVANTAPAVSLYQIGNSLTWDSQPQATVETAANQGITLSSGYHIRSSSSLLEIYNDPTSTTIPSASPYGNFTNALPNYEWDAFTFQPFSNGTSTLGDDQAVIDSLLAQSQSLAGNQTSTVFVYAPWPKSFQWDEWTQPITNSPTQPTEHREAYFNALTDNLAVSYGDRVKMIPVGHVLAEIRDRVDAGHYENYTNFLDFYRDPTHLSEVGRFVASTTVFATLTGESPVGLAPPNRWSDLAEIEALQQVVWDVVTRNPYTGILGRPSGDFDGDNDVDNDDLAIWAADAAQPLLLADINNDQRVDELDRAVIETAVYRPDTTEQADINNDGQIDEIDIAIWRSEFGADGSSAADTNQDGVVDGSDYALLVNAINDPMFRAAGDINGDGNADLNDIAILDAEFGTVYSLAADANSDKVVDFADYNLWNQFYTGPLNGSGAATAVASPEPAGALLALWGWSLVAPLRRR